MKKLIPAFLAVLLLAACTAPSAEVTPTPEPTPTPTVVVTPTPTAEPTPDPGPQIYTFAEFGAPVNGTGRFPLDESSSAQIAALVDLSPETVAGWTTVETWDRLYLVELTLADGRVACLEREQERILLRLNGQIYDCTESVDFDQLCRTLEAARLAAVRADLPQLTRLSIDVWDVPSFNREISLDAESSQFTWDTLSPDNWEVPDMYTEHDLARGWNDFVDLYCGDRLIARVTEGEIIGLEKSYTVIFYQIGGEKDQSAYIFAPEEAYKTLWNWAQGFPGELEPAESSAPVPLETPAADDTRYFFADGYFLGSWSDGTWRSCGEGENNFTVGEIFNRDYYDVFGDQFHSVRFYVGMADNNPRGGFEGTEFLEPFGIIEGVDFIMKLPGQLAGEAAQVAAPCYNFRAAFDGVTELISSNVPLEGPSHRYAENLLPEETLTQVLADAGIRCDMARTDRFAWELDMDSDGAEEYLELVRTHRDEDGYMNFGPGEQCFYAIILQDGNQVSVVTSKAISYTTDLTAQFYASDVQCRDLDGDGICEVIFNVTAWEGGGYQVLTFADGQWTCVLRSNYGT